jgi:protein-disulfide isomerase
VQPKSLDNLVAPPKTSINSDDVVIVIISDYTMSSCKSSANMLDHSNCP